MTTLASSSVRRWAWLAAGVLGTGLLLAWLMGAFRAKSEPGMHPPRAMAGTGLPKLVASVVRVPVTETAVGTVRAIHETAVASRVAGRIQVLNVERAGQPFEKDAVLAVLEDRDLRAAVAQAQASQKAAETRRDKAKVDLARTEELRKSGVASDDKLAVDRANSDAAVAEAERAREAVTAAESMLAYATIRAPMTGIVVDKKVNVGDMALPGVPLVTLYDPARLQLVAIVREELAGRLKIGQEVAVTLDALGHECVGKVAEIVPEAQARTRSFEVKVVGPCAPGVITGMFGRLAIPLGERDELRVPVAAIRTVGQLDFLFVVGRDDSLAMRAVRLGREVSEANGTRVAEVLSGLAAGETFVADAAKVGRP